MVLLVVSAQHHTRQTATISNNLQQSLRGVNSFFQLIVLYLIYLILFSIGNDCIMMVHLMAQINIFF